MRTSKTAVGTFVAGLLCLASGFLALATSSDLFLLGILAFGVLAFVLGITARAQVTRAGGSLRGGALAAWGMLIPAVGVGLGFLLLPGV